MMRVSLPRKYTTARAADAVKHLRKSIQTLLR